MTELRVLFNISPKSKIYNSSILHLQGTRSIASGIESHNPEIPILEILEFIHKK